MTDSKHSFPSSEGDRHSGSVLFIAPFIWEAGPNKGKPTIYYIMKGFRRAGYDVHVVTATNRRDAGDVEYEGLHLHYFRIPINLTAFDYDAMYSFLTLVRQEATKWRRHLLYRLFWLQFVLLGILKAAAVTRRCFPACTYGIMNSGIPVAYAIGLLRRIPNFSRITGSYILDYLRSPLHLWLVRFDEYLAFKLPCSRLIITKDGSMSVEEIHQELNIPVDRIWLLRNGIDKATFQAGGGKSAAKAQLGFTSAQDVVLSVSQLVDLKRVDRLIRAIPTIIEQHLQARFVIVGDGPYRADLQSLADDLGVSEFVRFEGFISRDSVPAYYRAADVFAAFYPYSNISNSLLEAMLSGNAVVTLNNGHTGEVVKHMVNGYLIEPDRLDEIPEALVRVLSDADLRRKLSAGAAAYADRELQTWDDRIDREIHEIERLINVNREPA